VDTAIAGTVRVISTVSALQAPDADRVSTAVWPPNTDQTTDACPALFSATCEVPIGFVFVKWLF
jgi:hypothetical protein